MSEVENPPAFPSVCMEDPGHPASVPGMTLRDWFAGQALAGLATKPDYVAAVHLNGLRDDASLCQRFANYSYTVADALLLARQTPSKEG